MVIILITKVHVFMAIIYRGVYSKKFLLDHYGSFETPCLDMLFSFLIFESINPLFNYWFNRGTSSEQSLSKENKQI